MKVVHKLRRKSLDHVDIHQEVIYRQVQRSAFPSEMKCLQRSEAISRKSKIVQLYPFLDENNVMRVGGRLAASDLNDDVKYSAIVPARHPLSQLIIRKSHHETMHSGQHATLVHIRQKFWIVGVRSMVRQLIWNCVICFRYNSRASSQLMGDLPKERISISPPFTYVGIDLAGPLRFKEQKEKFMCYVVIFV